MEISVVPDVADVKEALQYGFTARAYQWIDIFGFAQKRRMPKCGKL